MIWTTIVFSVLGTIGVLLTAAVASAPSSAACRACVGLWLASLSVGFFVVAAHPQWIPQ
jgi:hypothetical protein